MKDLFIANSDDKNIFIDHNDVYEGLYDMIVQSPGPKSKIGPVGWVKVYMEKNGISNLLHSGPNLIVAQGKEFVAQKIFEIYETDDGTVLPNYTNYKVSHFAVGGGGCTATGDVLEMHGPHIADTGLYKSISLGEELYLEEPRKITNDEVYNFKNAVKPINRHGGIHLEKATYEGTEAFTKVLCTCVVPPGEPSMILEGSSVQISEGGLYFVDNNPINQNNANAVKLFAHCCFAPKWKELESTLTIHWYVLF